MTREETKSLLKLILLAYPNFEVSAEKVELWAQMLTDVSHAAGNKNVMQHIKTSRFIPTIADVRAGVSTYEPPAEDAQIKELKRRMEWVSE